MGVFCCVRSIIHFLSSLCFVWGGGAGGCVDCYNKHQTFVSSSRVIKAAYKAYLEEQDRLYAEQLSKE